LKTRKLFVALCSVSEPRPEREVNVPLCGACAIESCTVRLRVLLKDAAQSQNILLFENDAGRSVSKDQFDLVSPVNHSLNSFEVEGLALPTLKNFTGRIFHAVFATMAR
jgi:hypothetical protein